MSENEHQEEYLTTKEIENYLFHKFVTVGLVADESDLHLLSHIVFEFLTDLGIVSEVEYYEDEE